jgi:hypothetical protein
MMNKALFGLAAGGLLLAVAGTAPAEARDRAVAPGVQNEQIEDVSSHRRRHRHVHRWHAPRYVYQQPYRHYGYSSYGYPHHRSYYGYHRGPSIGFSFGVGPRYW